MVPKIIHRIVGKKPSNLVVHCINSWEIIKDHGFEIRIWDDELIIKFITEHYPSVLPVFNAARNYGEASDIARYTILYHFGGYYFDWDVELLSLRKFLALAVQNSNGFLLQDPINQTLAPDVFSAVSKETYLHSLIDNICYIYQNGFAHTLDTISYTGPYRMREVFYFTKKKTKQNLIKPKDVLLYDYLEITKQPFRDEEVPMIHYWEHGWMK